MNEDTEHAYIKQLSLVAGIMLLLAIPPIWPYVYFQILKWVVVWSAGCGAYRAYELNETKWVILLTSVAVAFNPIAPLYFSREMWLILDFVAAVILFSYYKKLNRW